MMQASAMRSWTYGKYLPQLADAVNLQDLLDKLSDFLLQSGFAGGPSWHPYWGEFGNEDTRSMDALKEAILKALAESGQLTPDMLTVLRGESTGDEQRDAEVQRQLAELIDQVVQRLIDEGYLNVQQAPQVPQGHQPMFGPGGQAQSAAQQVEFNLTGKGIDFLGYRALRHLLGSIGRSSFGSHETAHLATGVEAEAVSKEYEFGDVMNLDVPGTLRRALARRIEAPTDRRTDPSITRSVDPSIIDLDYPDLMVHQSEYRSSAATVLMLDCSHSMILYGRTGSRPPRRWRWR
jgi:Ca-activated chloride channel homolog